MTAFHAQLIKNFLKNLSRAVLVFMVFVLSLHLPEQVPGLGAFFLLCLTVFGLVLPSAFLVAALFTVGDLAHNHELMALKAAGWSLLRIMWPLILVAAASIPLTAALPGAGSESQLSAQPSAAAQTAAHAERVFPLTNLLAVIIGIALASTPRRKSTFVGFMGAAVVFGAYFVATATAHAFGRHGGLPPVVAGWIAPVLFGGMAVLMWHRAE